MSGYRIDESEVEFSAIRSSGPGGQNVNKVATAVELRFDVPASSLSESAKARILALRDRRLSKDGVLVIKAQRFRTQESNRRDALERLQELVDQATRPRQQRVATRPGRAVRERRLRDKRHASEKKSRRGAVKFEQ